MSISEPTWDEYKQRCDEKGLEATPVDFIIWKQLTSANRERRERERNIVVVING